MAVPSDLILPPLAPVGSAAVSPHADESPRSLRPRSDRSDWRPASPPGQVALFLGITVCLGLLLGFAIGAVAMVRDRRTLSGATP